MVIYSPKLNPDLAKAANEKVLSIITDGGGEVIKVDDWGKRILAYPINKVSEGYYFVDYFRFESREIKTIKRLFNINEDIIRTMIVVKDEK